MVNLGVGSGAGARVRGGFIKGGVIGSLSLSGGSLRRKSMSDPQKCHIYDYVSPGIYPQDPAFTGDFPPTPFEGRSRADHAPPRCQGSPAGVFQDFGNRLREAGLNR